MATPLRTRLLPLVTLALLAGCSAPAPENVPDPPLVMTAKLASLGEFAGAGSELRLDVTSLEVAQPIRIGAVLPSGLEVVVGSLEYESLPPATGRVTRAATVRALADGDYVIRAFAEHQNREGGGRTAVERLIGVRVANGESTLFEPTRVQLSFEVRLTPDPRDHSRFRADITSSIDHNGTLVVVVPAPPSGTTLIRGPPQWIGHVRADTTTSIDYAIAAPERDAALVINAYYTPEAAVDIGVYHADVTIRFENGQATGAQT